MIVARTGGAAAGQRAAKRRSLSRERARLELGAALQRRRESLLSEAGTDAGAEAFGGDVEMVPGTAAGPTFSDLPRRTGTTGSQLGFDPMSTMRPMLERGASSSEAGAAARYALPPDDMAPLYEGERAEPTGPRAKTCWQRVTAAACFCLPNKRHAAVREMFGYLVFLLVFTSLVLTRAGLHGFSTRFWLAETARNQFSNKDPIFADGNRRFVFAEVSTVEALWDWLENPFVDALATAADDGNGTAGAVPVFYQRSAVLGDVLLHQKRARTVGCDLRLDLGGGDTTAAECVPPSASIDESRDAFGPSLQFAYRARPPQASENSRLLRPQSPFPAGGFFERLNMSASGEAGFRVALRARLAALREAGWIDEQTRAVFVDLTLLNPSTTFFTAVRHFFLVEASGGVTPQAFYRVHRFFQYENSVDWALFALEAVLYLFVLYFLCEELHEAWTMRLSYLASGWNLLDLLNIGLFVATLVLRTIGDFVAVDLRAALADGERYVDFQPLAYTQNQALNCTAFNAVLCWIKVFKYLGASASMSQLTRVLSRAAKNLAIFALMFMIVYAGFAIGFYLGFSTSAQEYSSLAASLLALFRTILGDFDFETLRTENTWLAPSMFALYVVLVGLILMAFFQALILDAYTRTCEEIEAAEKDEFAAQLHDWAASVGRRIKSVFHRRRAKVAPGVEPADQKSDGPRLEQVEDAVQRLRSADANQDRKLDRGELEAAVGGAEATDLLDRYDRNRDGALDDDELDKMSAELKSQALARAVRRLDRRNEEALRRSDAVERKLDEVLGLLARLAPRAATASARAGRRSMK